MSSSLLALAWPTCGYLRHLGSDPDDHLSVTVSLPSKYVCFYFKVSRLKKNSDHHCTKRGVREKERVFWMWGHQQAQEQKVDCLGGGVLDGEGDRLHLDSALANFCGVSRMWIQRLSLGVAMRVCSPSLGWESSSWKSKDAMGKEWVGTWRQNYGFCLSYSFFKYRHSLVYFVFHGVT